MSQKNDYKLPPDRSVNSVDAHFTIVGANRSVLYAGLWLKKSGAKLSGVASLEKGLICSWELLLPEILKIIVLSYQVILAYFILFLIHN